MLPRLLGGHHLLFIGLVLLKRYVEDFFAFVFSVAAFLFHHACNLVLWALHKLVYLTLSLMFNRVISFLLKAAVVVAM